MIDQFKNEAKLNLLFNLCGFCVTNIVNTFKMSVISLIC